MDIIEHDCPGLWDCRDHPKGRIVISRVTRRLYVIDAGPERGWVRAPFGGTFRDAVRVARVRAGWSL